MSQRSRRSWLPQAPEGVANSAFFQLADALHRTLEARVAANKLAPSQDILSEPQVVAFLTLAVGSASPPTTPLIPLMSGKPRSAGAAVGGGAGDDSTPKSATTWAAPCSSLPPQNCKTMAAFASVFHFLVLCESLPHGNTRALYVEGNALFQCLLRSWSLDDHRQEAARNGANTEALASFVITCAIHLRDETKPSSRSPFDKIVVDDALCSRLPRPRASPAEWSRSERFWVSVIARSYAVASISTRMSHSSGILLTTAPSLQLQMMSVAETILDARLRTTSAPRVSSLLPAWEGAVLRHILGAFCFFACSGSSRLFALVNRLTATRVVQSAFRDEDGSLFRLTAVATWLTLRFVHVRCESPPPQQQQQSGLDELDEGGAGEDVDRTIPARKLHVWLRLLNVASKKSEPANDELPTTTTSPAAADPAKAKPSPEPINIATATLLLRAIPKFLSEYATGRRPQSMACSDRGGGAAPSSSALSNSKPRDSIPDLLDLGGTGSPSLGSSSSSTARARRLSRRASRSVAEWVYADRDKDMCALHQLNSDGNDDDDDSDSDIDDDLNDSSRRDAFGESDASSPGAGARGSSFPVAATASSFSGMRPPSALSRFAVTGEHLDGVDELTALAQDVGILFTRSHSLFSALQAPQSLPRGDSLRDELDTYISTLEKHLMADLHKMLEDVRTTVAACVPHGTRIHKTTLGETMLSVAAMLLHQSFKSLQTASPSSQLLTSPAISEGGGRPGGSAGGGANRGGEGFDAAGGGSEPSSSTVDLGASSMILRCICMTFPFVQRFVLGELTDVIATGALRTPPPSTAAATGSSSSSSGVPPNPGPEGAASTPSSRPGSSHRLARFDYSELPFGALHKFSFSLMTKIAFTDRATWGISPGCDAAAPSAVASSTLPVSSAYRGPVRLPSSIAAVIASASAEAATRAGDRNRNNARVCSSRSNRTAARPKPPTSIGIEELERVCDFVCDQFIDVLRNEVVKGRTISSADAQSAALSSTPMYFSMNFVVLYNILTQLASAIEIRTRYVAREVDQAMQARGSCFASHSLRNGNPLCDIEVDEDDGGDRESAERATHRARLRSAWIADASASLEADIRAAESIDRALVKLLVTAGWPAAGTLYPSNRQEGLQQLSASSAVFATVFAPLFSLLASLSQVKALSSRMAQFLRRWSRNNFAASEAEITALWGTFLRPYGVHPLHPLTDRPLGYSCLELDEGGVGAPGEAAAHNTNTGQDGGHPAATTAAPGVDAQMSRYRTLWLLATLHGLTATAVEHFNVAFRCAGGASSSVVGTTGSLSNGTAAAAGGERSSPAVASYVADPAAPASAAAAAVGSRANVGGRSGRHRRHESTTGGSGGTDGSGRSGDSAASYIRSSVLAAISAVRMEGEAGAQRNCIHSLANLASVSPPVLLLRSTECQQMFADISTVEKYLGPKGCAEFLKLSQAYFSRLHPPLGVIAARNTLSLPEMVLLRVLVDVESLRAATGTLHPSVLLSQVELREFVASRDFLDALPLVSDWICHVYLCGLRAEPVVVSRLWRLVSLDVRVLTALAALGVRSVREHSARLLRAISDAFPHVCSDAALLEACLRTVNLTQAADEAELSAYARSLNVRHVSIVTSAPQNSERQTVLRALIQLAITWLDAGRASAPLRLFESAIAYILFHEANNVLALEHFAGSDLAMRACSSSSTAVTVQDMRSIAASSASPATTGGGGEGFSTTTYTGGVIPRSSRRGVLALTSSRIRNYANTVMQRSYASGSLVAALQYSDVDVVERTVLQHLQRCVRTLLSKLSTAINMSERSIVQLLAAGSVGATGASAAAAGGGAAAAASSPSGGGAMLLSPALASRRTNRRVSMNDNDSDHHRRDASDLVELFDILGLASAFVNSGRLHRPVLPSYLTYLVKGPVQIFTASVLHKAVGCWKWMMMTSTSSETQNLSQARLFLATVCDALCWTCTQRMGLFDAAPSVFRIRVETGASVGEAYRIASRLHHGGGEGADLMYATDYGSNSPHKILLAFLAEQFLDNRFPLANDPVVVRLLLHLVAVWTEDPSLWSNKDESFSEYMRAIFFCLSVIENAHTLNQKAASAAALYSGPFGPAAPALCIPYGCLVTLRARTYDCLLRWFSKTPPSYYLASQLQTAVTNEVVVLEELLEVLGREQDALSTNSLGFLPREKDMSEALSVPSYSMVSGAALRRSVARSQSSDGGAGTSKRVTHPDGAASGSGGGGGRADTSSKKSHAAPLVSHAFRRLHNTLGLLRFLVKHEAQRLLIWSDPRLAQRGLGTASSKLFLALHETTPQLWRAYSEAAAAASPAMLTAFAARFPSSPVVQRIAAAAVTNNPAAYAHLPEAVDLYLHEGTLQAGVDDLYLWTPCSILQALRLLDESLSAYPDVVRFAVRSLTAAASHYLIFYLPQLLQCYQHDRSGAIEDFFRTMCRDSNEFTHQLLWALQTEEEGLNTPLAIKCKALSSSIRAAMTPEQAQFYEREFRYVAAVTSLSGKMKPVEKPKRKETLRKALRDGGDEFHTPIREAQLYLPTNPTSRIVRLVPDTAGAMQSAAKCPIMVQFEVVDRNPEDITAAAVEVVADKALPASQQQQPPPSYKSCIFKMGDDCRQDQIALQLIELFRRIMSALNLPSFLCPYRVVTTGASSGVIECVPNAKSRDQIGKLVESNLAEYFVQIYGHPQSPSFRRARQNFILSMASYSVASYILNIKDRHNGNIMLDQDGHVIHIDFGFIFDYSPGGDINFESSPFKLTQEMLQLMGDSVTGRHTVQSPELAQALSDPEAYETFVVQTVKCYLAVREYAREICVLVELMLGSGLPCFKPKKTIADLAHRLSLHRNEVEAAAFMFDRVAESRDNIRTRLYDRYQNIAEGIEM